MSINKVMISGNLTRDPESRSTTSGMSVLGLGVAVNDRRKNQSTGEWEDFPNFIDCTIFGTRADNVKPYLAKGSKVAIEGKLRWSQWKRVDEHGKEQTRSKIEVVVDEIEFLSIKPGAGGASQQSQSRPAEIPEAPAVTVYEDDIPF